MSIVKPKDPGVFVTENTTALNYVPTTFYGDWKKSAGSVTYDKIFNLGDPM